MFIPNFHHQVPVRTIGRIFFNESIVVRLMHLDKRLSQIFHFDFARLAVTVETHFLHLPIHLDPTDPTALFRVVAVGLHQLQTFRRCPYVEPDERRCKEKKPISLLECLRLGANLRIKKYRKFDQIDLVYSI
jgi:hypothetical protein